MRRFAALALLLAFTAACAPVTPKVNTGTFGDTNPGKAAADATSAKPAEQKPAPTWDQSYTFPDKISVVVSKPVACTPSRSAYPEGVKRAAKITFKVANGSDKPFDTSVLSFGTEVQFAGAKAETLIDVSGACKAGGGMEAATVLPGKSYSYTAAYVAPQAGEWQIAMSTAFGEDKAVFTGQG